MGKYYLSFDQYIKLSSDKQKEYDWKFRKNHISSGNFYTISFSLLIALIVASVSLSLLVTTHPTLPPEVKQKGTELLIESVRIAKGGFFVIIGSMFFDLVWTLICFYKQYKWIKRNV